MFLKKVSTNVSGGALPVSIAFVEDIYNIKSVGVFLLHGVEFLTKQYVLLSDVGI